uniref:Natural cytotoxicity triggering receptor 3 n=1 Tax=Xenopus tropicalis TaxID=8364 RepID=A0A803JFP4_XENTR
MWLSGSLSQNIEVSQIPEVNAIEGGTANLECSYNLSNLDLSIGWYSWYRHVLHGVDILYSDDFKGRITKESTENFLNKRSASIQLHRVTVTDTGMYFCAVEFSGQTQIKGHGNGTFLNVTAFIGQIALHNHFPVYIGVGALAVVSAVLVGAYLGVTKHGFSTSDTGPIVYTDFTAQGSRSGGAPNQPSQQGSQIAGNTLYSMDNDQYIYAEPRGKKKSQIHKEYHEVSLYSEIP